MRISSLSLVLAVGASLSACVANDSDSENDQGVDPTAQSAASLETDEDFGDPVAPVVCPEGNPSCDVPIDPDDEEEITPYTMTDPSYRAWPKGVVPYVISSTVGTYTKQRLLSAMSAWETKTGRINFRAKTSTDTTWITVTAGSPRVSPHVGYKSGANSTLYLRNPEYENVIRHELGHILGFHHEHKRSDRAGKVMIRTQYISSSNNCPYQFSVCSTCPLVGSYNLRSIMHYRSHDMSGCQINGNDIVLKPDGSVITRDYNPWNITSGDIDSVLKYYGGTTCTAESNTQFCARRSKNCGSVTGTDNCGATRTVSCGSCTAPATCGGGGTANVCGTAPIKKAKGSDVDGDGRADLVSVGTNGNAYVWRSTSTGAFSSAVASFERTFDLANVDGSGHFVVGVADVNGDGKADLVSAHTNGNAYVYPGTSTGNFGAYVSSFAGTLNLANLDGVGHHVVGLADVNGDGRADLVTAHSNGNVYVYPGGSTGSFGSGVASFNATFNLANRDGVGHYVVGVADVTGDGRADLVTANSNKNVYVYPGTASGAFGSYVSTFAGTFDLANIDGVGHYVVGVADVTGDGKADLITAHSGGNVYTYPGTASGAFSTTWASTFAGTFNLANLDGVGHHVVGISDVTGDGKADLVTAHDNGNAYVYPGTSTGAFSTAWVSSFAGTLDIANLDGVGHYLVGPTGPSILSNGVRYLSDLAWTSATNGWGPAEKDKANGEWNAGDGGPITINAVQYAKGLGVHANSTITYSLGGAYTRFKADIGVDDYSAAGSVIFRVYKDGVLAYDSGLMVGTTTKKSIDLSVAAANELKLVVTDGGDGNNSDHADWANARLVR